MKTWIALEKYRNGKLVDSRRQLSRSFVKGLFDLLYIAHAQIPSGAPHTCTDVMGQSRKIDQEAYADGAVRGYKGTLQLAAPPGDAGIFIPTGSNFSDHGARTLAAKDHHFMRGENLGIQVGVGTTAVTPDDRQIEEKVFHGLNGSVGVDSKFDYFDVASDDELTMDAAAEHAQLLVLPVRGFRMSSLKLLLYKAGNPGDITMKVRGVKTTSTSNFNPEDTEIVAQTTNGNTLPVGAPYEWREFVLPNSIDMNPGLIYSIDLNVPGATGADMVMWRVKDYGGDERRRYGGGFSAMGTTYTNYGSRVPCFELWGTAQAELEYSGCEIYGLSIVNPNGQFNVRRLFTNGSGESITINEVGMYAGATVYQTANENQYYWRLGDVWSFCIARDIVSPGIEVADGEVLAVTYTPQITV